MNKRFCQFWCKPQNKAVYSCKECGEHVFDSVAFLCQQCSDRQHSRDQPGHDLVAIKDFLKMSQEDLGPGFSGEKPGRSERSGSGRSERSEMGDAVVKSTLLVDDCENLCVDDVQSLAETIGISPDSPVNVLSIFGNTGDGKSHTLNHVFFGGREVFTTSGTQKTGTVGMWVAYDSKTRTLVIDTEGLLGVSSNLNRRTRLLLKILALSDVAIYRTRAERLHNDMFVFLSDASKVYCDHFSTELQVVLEKHSIDIPFTKLGPRVLIFHETQYTEILGAPEDDGTEIIAVDPDRPDDGEVDIGVSLSSLGDEVADREILQRFLALGEYPKAFSKIRYIGIKSGSGPTDFTALTRGIREELSGNSARSRKPLTLIMESLRVLNSKFSNGITQKPLSTFSDDFFRCPQICSSCRQQCSLSVSHSGSHLLTEKYCRYQHAFKNRIFICTKCYNDGCRREVRPKSFEDSETPLSGYMKLAWYVIECDDCGVIYRSRQYWFGNKTPEQESVRTEIVHVWPGEEAKPENTARFLLDQLYVISETIGQYGAGPTQVMTDWLNDQISPAYWVPNHIVTSCHACKVQFVPLAKKHHCRACGQGFCCDCSSRSKPVPWRGWGDDPVRVCDRCFTSTDKQLEEDYCTEDLTPWKVTECLKTAASVVKTIAVDVPAGIVTDSVRPDYWVPDVDIVECYQCKSAIADYKHHCRSCGQGFCDVCTQDRKCVPERGWDYAVRVCDTCSLMLQ